METWCYEELVELEKEMHKVKRKVSSELNELKRRGLDVKDPIFLRAQCGIPERLKASKKRLLRI